MEDLWEMWAVRPLSVLLIRVAPLVDYKTPSSFSMIVTFPGHQEAKLPTNLLHRSDLIICAAFSLF